MILAGRVEKALRAGQIDFQQLLEQGQHEVGLLDEICEEPLVAAQCIAGLEERIEAATGLERVVGAFIERARLLGQPGRVAWIGHVRPGVAVQVVDGGLGQRRLGDLEIEGVVPIPEFAPLDAPQIDKAARLAGWRRPVDRPATAQRITVAAQPPHHCVVQPGRAILLAERLDLTLRQS